MIADPGMPRNAVTGTEYAGANPARLLTAEETYGYSGHDWAGFKQWITVGRVVRKGEHGTACRRVITVPDKKGGTRTACRGFVVFHRDQTDALSDAPAEALPVNTSGDDAAALAVETAGREVFELTAEIGA